MFGGRMMVNFGSSAYKSSQADSSWRKVRLQKSGEPFPKFYDSYWKGRLSSEDPCRTLKGWPLKPGRTGGINKRLGSRSNPPENILYTTMRSPRRRRLRKECRPSRRSLSSYGSRRKPFTSLVSNRWIFSNQSGLEKRYGEQACITNWTCNKGGQTWTQIAQRTAALSWTIYDGWRSRRKCLWERPGVLFKIWVVL